MVPPMPKAALYHRSLKYNLGRQTMVGWLATTNGPAKDCAIVPAVDYSIESKMVYMTSI